MQSGNVDECGVCEGLSNTCALNLQMHADFRGYPFSVRTPPDAATQVCSLMVMYRRQTLNEAIQSGYPSNVKYTYNQCSNRMSSGLQKDGVMREVICLLRQKSLYSFLKSTIGRQECVKKNRSLTGLCYDCNMFMADGVHTLHFLCLSATSTLGIKTLEFLDIKRLIPHPGDRLIHGSLSAGRIGAG